jgi:hypothetical protein
VLQVVAFSDVLGKFGIGKSCKMLWLESRENFEPWRIAQNVSDLDAIIDMNVCQNVFVYLTSYSFL